MRVINNHQVTTTTSQVRTNTNSVIHTTLVRVPTSTRLTVRRQLNLGKDLTVLVTLNQVLRLTTKVYRQLSRVRRLNDLLVRHTAHEPRRKQITRELTLRVPRCHVDYQTLQLTFRHAI